MKKKVKKSKTIKNKNPRNAVTAKNVLLVLGVIVIIVVGFISNVIPFAYNVVRCGRLPVQSTTFASSYTYKLPGDKGYGISLFDSYHFCTEQEIKPMNMYHRTKNLFN